MDAEERPSKLRKLEVPARNNLETELVAPLLEPTNDTAAKLENSKPRQQAANFAGASEVRSENGWEDDSDKGDHGEDSERQDEAQQEQQNGQSTKPMSKNQLKKLRKREEWEAGREYRKVKRKQKTQERRQRKRAAREEEAQRQGLLEEAQGQQDGQQKQKQHHPSTVRQRSRRPVLLPVTIVIDCGFDDLMMEKERISLGSQLTRSYSDNWRAPFQMHLVISSWGGILKERFDTVLHKHYLNWKGVVFEKGDFVQAAEKAKEVMKGSKGGKLAGIFQKDIDENGNTETAAAPRPKSAGGEGSSKSPGSTPADAYNHDDIPSSMTTSTQIINSAQPVVHTEEPPSHSASEPSQGEIVYLTSDSPHTLSTLHPYSTYIVGGLVDKNRHKGICYKIACERGIKTAKLPIGEYMEMQSRKVLATNHVVEIMIRYLECGDWGEAFLKVIPKRKGGRLRGQAHSDEEDGEDDDGQGANDFVDGYEENERGRRGRFKERDDHLAASLDDAAEPAS